MSNDKRRPGTTPGAKHSAQPKVNSAGTVEKAIGSRLRAYYDEVAKEPVPDRFLDLLKRLDRQEPDKG